MAPLIMIVPKRQNMVDGIENVIISLYAKGMSNSDIEEQISEVYGLMFLLLLYRELQTGSVMIL